MELLLERFAFGPNGTFGHLVISGTGFECFTVERPGWPWVPFNQPSVACIPDGSYELRLGTFYRNTPDPSDDYPSYEFIDVPGRSLIKIHRGNTIRDLRGCIAPGGRLGWIAGLPAVTGSRTAYANLMAEMGGAQEARILIREKRGEVAV